MRFDLHCNLPYPFVIPNAALGYLKGFLSGDSSIVVRNIYWNMLPEDLSNKYLQLSGGSNKMLTPFGTDDKIVACIARYLYDINQTNESKSELSPFFQSPFSYSNKLKSFALDLKKYIDTTLEEKTLDNIDIAGFTSKMNQWILNYYVLCKLKNYNSSIRTIIGGITSQSQGLEFMRVFKEADFAVWGEGEVSLLRLLQQIDNPEEYKEIPNLIYRDNGKIVSTYEIGYEDLPDIDTYPFADHTDYFNELDKNDRQHSTCIPIWGTRSCWWSKCKFCVFNEGLFYRERSPENIVAEIEYQSKKHNVDDFTFVDNDIGRKDRKSFDQLLKLLLKSSNERKRPYHIGSELSPFRLERTSINALKKIVIEEINFGFEAMTDSLLKKMKRPQSFAHNIQAFKLADEQNFLLPPRNKNIIRGVPSETAEDVIESMRNLKFLRFLLGKYGLTPINFILNKGSPFFKELTSEEIEEHWNNCDLWSEMKDLNFMASSDKREFFGFESGLINSNLWEKFQVVLDQYMSDCFSYRWFEYSDGSSVIEEYGRDVVDLRCRYTLSPLETALLTFCDTVRSFSDVRRHFMDVGDGELKRVVVPLKEAGLLYFNDDFKYHIISIMARKNQICVK